MRLGPCHRSEGSRLGSIQPIKVVAIVNKLRPRFANALCKRECMYCTRRSVVQWWSAECKEPEVLLDDARLELEVGTYTAV